MKISEKAFEIAAKRQSAGRKTSKVTVVHKANVLSISDGLFRECFLEIAKKYPRIQTEEQLIDSCVYRMFRNPQSFDVLVAPNMYGDILSDGAAAVVGGLGIVPSANLGDDFLLAEPGNYFCILFSFHANPHLCKSIVFDYRFSAWKCP
eukprot:Sdes_comp18705_c0_seq2m9015